MKTAIINKNYQLATTQIVICREHVPKMTNTTNCIYDSSDRLISKLPKCSSFAYFLPKLQKFVVSGAKNMQTGKVEANDILLKSIKQ